VIWVRNDEYPVSLEVRKLYQTIRDPDSESRQLLKVIDESGEDYLYPEDFFLPIESSEEAALTIRLTEGL